MTGRSVRHGRLARGVLVVLALAVALLALTGTVGGQAQAAGARAVPMAPQALMLPADDCQDQTGAFVTEDDNQCYADKFDEYGDNKENGCDGWGEPTGFCQSKAAEMGSPSWIKDFPGWVKYQVFDMARSVFTWWATLGDPQLRKSDGGANGTVGYITQYTNIVVYFFLILSVLIAVIRLAFARDGKPAKELFKSLVTFTLVSGLLLLFADMLIKTSRAFFDYTIRTGMGRPSETASTALTTGIWEMLAGINSGDDFHLLDVVGGIIIICVSLVLYVHMVIRYFLIIYYVGTMPLMAAAAAVGESGKQALKDQCIRLMVWIFILDLMGLMLVIGYREILIGTSNTALTGAAATWRGLIVLCLITMVLPATMRAAAPFMSHAAGSTQQTAGAARAGLAVGALAIGGVAWGATRGLAALGARGAAGAAAGAAGGGGGAGGAVAAAAGGGGGGGGGGGAALVRGAGGGAPGGPGAGRARAGQPPGPANPGVRARAGQPPGPANPGVRARAGAGGGPGNQAGGGGVLAHPAGAVGDAGTPADLAAKNLGQSDPRVGLPDPLPRGEVGTDPLPPGSSDAAVLVDAGEKRIQWLHAQGDTNMSSADYDAVESGHNAAQQRAADVVSSASGAGQAQLAQVGQYVQERSMGRIENPITPAEAERASRNGTLPSLLNARMGLSGSGSTSGSGGTGGGGGMPPGPGGAGSARPPAPPTA
ncbi:hypothetical protein GCM10023205_39030 [Yinghuangia aomiensis]|uniref:TrbL/VirB6 plasmid conjugal transfer protein n=1 Tax=Yinghuangia aomiensis TaxID=676205 RepID=A0ABP9HFS0_9ACTN